MYINRTNILLCVPIQFFVVNLIVRLFLKIVKHMHVHKVLLLWCKVHMFQASYILTFRCLIHIKHKLVMCRSSFKYFQVLNYLFSSLFIFCWWIFIKIKLIFEQQIFLFTALFNKGTVNTVWSNLSEVLLNQYMYTLYPGQMSYHKYTIT